MTRSTPRTTPTTTMEDPLNRLSYDDIYSDIRDALFARDYNRYASAVMRASRMNAVPVTAAPSARYVAYANDVHDKLGTFDRWVHRIALTLTGERL